MGEGQWGPPPDVQVRDGVALPRVGPDVAGNGVSREDKGTDRDAVVDVEQCRVSAFMGCHVGAGEADAGPSAMIVHGEIGQPFLRAAIDGVRDECPLSFYLRHA